MVRFIQRYVNGGIYGIEFKGRAPEFNGIHPAVIIRTLKEDELFVVIPLTSYTPERWEKTKRYGYGTRILETNSIAKIDKFKVIHKDNIKNRWVDSETKLAVKIKKESFVKLNDKFNEYCYLSGKKASTEYDKFVEISNIVEANFISIHHDKSYSEGIFEIQTDSTTEIIYRCKKSALNMYSMEDLKLFIRTINHNAEVVIHGDYVIIRIEKNVDKEC